MELVYLWIEGYGSIENQGFNFSPRFSCEFKAEFIQNEYGHNVLKEDCKLIIMPNEYIENFFYDDICITCIVGKNGSGKSTILDGLQKIFEILPQDGFKQIIDDNLSEECFGFILLVSENDKLYYISNQKVSICCDAAESVNSIDPIQHLSYKAESQIPEELKNQITLDKEAIVRMITHTNDDLGFELTTFMYIPEKIKISPKSLRAVYEELIEDITPYPWTIDSEGMSIQEEDKHDKFLRNQKRDFEHIASELFSDAIDDYHRFLMLWYISDYDFDESALRDKEVLLEKYTTEESLHIREEEFSKLFRDRYLLISDLSDRERYIYLKQYIELFDFDFVDKRNRYYEHLSHGEKTIFGQFLNLYFRSQYKTAKDEFLLFFDEPESALHPEWQRKYIYELVTLLSKLKKKFHLVFTSHSPFLLSDLPKENVIFLIDGKQIKINMETFGSNIHTLLTHGFFMENGLMGEFAKEKINQVINYLHQKQLTEEEMEYCENIISIIGEPILKRQLQKMLDSKRLSEVEHIKKQIKELQEELAKKEDKKND